MPKELPYEAIAESPSTGKFSIHPNFAGRNSTAVCQITKTRHVVLNFASENSQRDLKEVYDSGPQYQKWIVAPAKYRAPWQP